MKLPIDAIRMDGGTQPRTAINEAVVAEYAEVYASGGTLPDPVVFFDGAEYWLADGFHRTHGRRQAGLLDIVVDLRQGTRRDAILFSAGANATHGLRRTPDDKRKAARTLLEDEEWGKWSDREIARRIGVGHTLVGDVRASLSAPDSQPAERTYTTKHGTKATMDTSGQKKAGAERVKEKAARAPAPAPAAPPAAAPAPSPQEDLGPSTQELLEETQRDVERLTSHIAAMEKDDAKAELGRALRMRDNAVREQGLAAEKALAAERRENWTHRQLMRCGKAVGQTDPEKIAASVEAFVRDHAKPLPKKAAA